MLVSEVVPTLLTKDLAHYVRVTRETEKHWLSRNSHLQCVAQLVGWARSWPQATLRSQNTEAGLMSGSGMHTSVTLMFRWFFSVKWLHIVSKLQNESSQLDTDSDALMHHKWSLTEIPATISTASHKMHAGTATNTIIQLTSMHQNRVIHAFQSAPCMCILAWFRPNGAMLPALQRTQFLHVRIAFTHDRSLHASHFNTPGFL